MLVHFTFKNFLSFKEEAVLDMTAIKAYKEHEYNLINQSAKENFIKVAAIYGANASGKSNLYYAFKTFQGIIIESLNNIANEDTKVLEKYYQPFLFDKEKENTEFEIIKVLDEFEYKYGFEYNEKQIVSEWMYRKSVKNNRTAIIFERHDGKVDFGSSIKKECDAFKEQVPAEALILSFFNKLKLKTNVFASMYQGIMDTLVVDTDFYEDINIIEKVLPNPDKPEKF